MARNPKLTKAQWTAWDEQGQPKEWFTYRGQRMQSPHPNMILETTPGTVSLEELKDRAITLWKKDQSHAVDLGETLLQIKKLMPHGDFNKWWMRAGLSQARVSYCMRLADGNKVKVAKERAKLSKRAKVLRFAHKGFANVYHLVEDNKMEEAKELFDQTVEELEARLIGTVDKPLRAAAARAGR